jgi:hypothetical protein
LFRAGGADFNNQIGHLPDAGDHFRDGGASLIDQLGALRHPFDAGIARAASTAALSAKMWVWKAMPSITPMMSEILREASLMPRRVSTTWASRLADSAAAGCCG